MDENIIQNELEAQFKAVYGTSSNKMTPVIMGYEGEHGLVCELSTDRIGYYGVTVIDGVEKAPHRNQVFFEVHDARKYMKAMFKNRGRKLKKAERRLTKQ